MTPKVPKRLKELLKSSKSIVPNIEPRILGSKLQIAPDNFEFEHSQSIFSKCSVKFNVLGITFMPRLTAWTKIVLSGTKSKLSGSKKFVQS